MSSHEHRALSATDRRALKYTRVSGRTFVVVADLGGVRRAVCQCTDLEWCRLQLKQWQNPTVYQKTKKGWQEV